MEWNWQQPEWPNFSYDPTRLNKAEEQFLIGGGAFAGTVKHLEETDREQLIIEAISSEALMTSQIEGEVLDRGSVQSSIRKQLGFATDKRRVKPAEQGIAEMMVDLYRTFEEPLSDDMLFRWHRMLTNGRDDLKNIGEYRAGREPMQIVSGTSYAPRVHYEAPPSSRVAKEMKRFVKWFNRTAPYRAEPLPPLRRAGIAHLYFESIHPFEDGNGRIGRAIAEKALAQSLGQPTLTALAATILLRRKTYYTALERASKANEITPWLAWFAGIALEAQRRTAANIEFLIDKTKMLDRLRGQLNDRQEKALLRMLQEGSEGFEGGMSAGKYGTITKASPATATRDLADLVAKGALARSGELRHARYRIDIPLRPVTPVTIDARGRLTVKFIMALVEFCDVGYEIGGRTILAGLSFAVEAGETLVLLGRSGSGKTTALRMANGLVFPTSGTVLVEGRATTEWNPIRLKRRIGYVIQEVGLFPHFTVAENVGLVPQLEGWSAADIARRVDELLVRAGLTPEEYRARYPRQLSGGQRQRVGVARALAADPTILLFDEPFGALDPVTRRELQQQFLELQRTSIFVTHDVREAMRLGSRVALLAEGRLQAMATPEEFRKLTSEVARPFLAALED